MLSAEPSNGRVYVSAEDSRALETLSVAHMLLSATSDNRSVEHTFSRITMYCLRTQLTEGVECTP